MKIQKILLNLGEKNGIYYFQRKGKIANCKEIVRARIGSQKAGVPSTNKKSALFHLAQDQSNKGCLFLGLSFCVVCPFQGHLQTREELYAPLSLTPPFFNIHDLLISMTFSVLIMLTIPLIVQIIKSQNSFGQSALQPEIASYLHVMSHIQPTAN